MGSGSRLLGPEGEFHDEEGNEVPLSWWSPASWAAFRRLTRCLGAPDSEPLWRGALGARLLWQSFEGALARSTAPADAAVSGLSSMPDQRKLFFVAYCLFLCAMPHEHNEYVPRRISLRRVGVGNLALELLG